MKIFAEINRLDRLKEILAGRSRYTHGSVDRTLSEILEVLRCSLAAAESKKWTCNHGVVDEICDLLATAQTELAAYSQDDVKQIDDLAHNYDTVFAALSSVVSDTNKQIHDISLYCRVHHNPICLCLACAIHTKSIIDSLF